MVQAQDIYSLPEQEKPSQDGDLLNRKYSDTICLTKAPKFNNPTRRYKSTYDFSSPRRFKTVVKLEPTLAPVRYYRAINYGIPKELRHKSSVDCDFRPRAREFSETTWIFPKQGRDIYTSTLERNLLVDSRWYKSNVSVTSADTAVKDHPVADTEKITALNGGAYTSINEDDNTTNNNYKKVVGKRNGSVGALEASDEDELIEA